MKAGTLVKGLHLLTVLSAKSSDYSLTELARALEIDKSAVHRILAVMETMGFVEKNQTTKRYTVGPQFRALVSTNYGKIQRAALPAMRSLSESLGITVALRIREGKQMVVIDRVESTDLLRVSFPLGLRHSILFGSAGKAFLAFLPTNEAMQLLGSGSLTRNAALWSSLARIKKRGYATSRGTAVKGAIAASVPIVTANGRPIAVLSLSWPSAKYPSRRIKQLAEAGVKGAHRVSKALRDDSSGIDEPALGLKDALNPSVIRKAGNEEYL
jgi:IclR family transcriptional regulator, KDG regulon repressor